MNFFEAIIAAIVFLVSGLLRGLLFMIIAVPIVWIFWGLDNETALLVALGICWALGIITEIVQ